MIDFYHL